MSDGWTVVIPIKATDDAKSRMGGSTERRARLTLAMGLDVVDAAAAADGVDEVVVVTGARLAGEFGARVVADPGGGLLAAIEAGLAASTGNVAVLLGDVPGLDSGELAAALDAARGYDRAVVRDADGTGTVLVTARAGTPHSLAFGPDSFALHRAAGYAALTTPWPTLRRDVDVTAHLDGLTLGPRTAALLASER